MSNFVRSCKDTNSYLAGFGSCIKLLFSLVLVSSKVDARVTVSYSLGDCVLVLKLCICCLLYFHIRLKVSEPRSIAIGFRMQVWSVWWWFGQTRMEVRLLNDVCLTREALLMLDTSYVLFWSGQVPLSKPIPV